MNAQREIIYKQRREVLDGENLKDKILNMISSVAEEIIDTHAANPEEINKEALLAETKNILGIENLNELKSDSIDSEKLKEELKEKAHKLYSDKETEITAEHLRELERVVLLKVVDQKWMNHIDSMDELKNGIGLRAYGQKDPVVQYRIEGFEMFDQMINDIKTDVVKILMHVQEAGKVERKQVVKITHEGTENQVTNSPKQSATNTTVKNDEPRVGRNDPCPCGSGKKYKQCCGK